MRCNSFLGGPGEINSSSVTSDICYEDNITVSSTLSALMIASAIVESQDGDIDFRSFTAIPAKIFNLGIS